MLALHPVARPREHRPPPVVRGGAVAWCSALTRVCGGNQAGAPRRVHTVSNCMDPAARHVRPRGPRVRYSPSVEDQRPQLGGELGPDLLQQDAAARKTDIRR